MLVDADAHAHIAMTTATTTLYLDFDGVLHPLGTPVLDAAGHWHPEWPGLFCWLPLLEHALRPYPATQIVVSSSWRFFHSDAELGSFLGPLAARFKGITMSDHEDWSRLDEILRHAEESGHKRFLALDDDASIRAHEREERDLRFMWCSPESGISSQAFLIRLHAHLRELHAGILQGA